MPIATHTTLPAGAPPAQPFGAARHVSCQRGAAGIGPALARLYGNLYASLPHFALDHDLASCYAYAVHQDSRLRVLLVFVLQDRQAQVLNEVVALDGAELDALPTMCSATSRPSRRSACARCRWRAGRRATCASTTTTWRTR